MLEGGDLSANTLPLLEPALPTDNGDGGVDGLELEEATRSLAGELLAIS